MKWSDFMKTKKSKRFLNLATLCLALLGTTLLTTQPVKANSDTRESHGRLDQRGEDPYEKGRRDGYSEGREAGLMKDAQPEPPSDTPKPKNNPYEKKEDRQSYQAGHKSMYNHGYFSGWHATHDKKHQADESSDREDTTQGREHQTDESFGREDTTKGREHQTDESFGREDATHDKEHQADESSGGEDATLDEIGDIILGIVAGFINWFYNLF
ncbi:hypothetical protein ETT68_01965 [Streptococcus pyogenes]|nr:hypothetical protein ETT68_01965 [Streptococcus pyogenes]